MLNIPAFEFVLSRVPWTTFHTLTFRCIRDWSESRMMDEGVAWLRRMALLDDTAWMRFIWVLRFELGEATGRPHLHALIVAKEDTVNKYLVSRYGVPLSHDEWGLGLTSHLRIHGYADPVVGYMLKGDKGGGSA